MYVKARHHSCHAFYFLINRHSVSVNLIITDRIASSGHFISAISFHRIDCSFYHAFYNSHMACLSVPFPHKKDYISCLWNITCVLPLPILLKPFGPYGTFCKFGNCVTCNISALISTPAHKAGAPFLSAGKSIPAPVGVSPIAFLSQRHLHNRLAPGSRGDTPKHVVSQHMGYVLLIPVTAPTVPFRHHFREFHRIGIGISSIILFRPGNIPVPVVISLQGEFYMIHIYRTFHVRLPQTSRKVLDTYINGILRICDPVWRIGVSGIISALGRLHGITSLPALISSTYSSIPYCLAY